MWLMLTIHYVMSWSKLWLSNTIISLDCISYNASSKVWNWHLMYRVFEIMLQISMLCKLLEKLRLKNSHIYTGKLNPAIWKSLADVIINESHSVIIVRSVCLVFSFTQWLQVPVWYLAPPWTNWIPLQSVVYLLIIADGGDLCDVIQLAEGFCYTRKLQMPLSLKHV